MKGFVVVTFAEAPTGNCESDGTKRESVFLGMKRGVFEKGQSCTIMDTADMAICWGIWLSSDLEHVSILALFFEICIIQYITGYR